MMATHTFPPSYGPSPRAMSSVLDCSGVNAIEDVTILSWACWEVLGMGPLSSLHGNCWMPIESAGLSSASPLASVKYSYVCQNYPLHIPQYNYPRNEPHTPPTPTNSTAAASVSSVQSNSTTTQGDVTSLRLWKEVFPIQFAITTRYHPRQGQPPASHSVFFNYPYNAFLG